jgi:hypothetical protein
MLQTGINEKGEELNNDEMSGIAQHMRLMEAMQDNKSPVEKVSKDVVNFSKMKQLLYDMKEIDNDPTSEVAQKYYDLTDKVQVKRPAHVMIKEMKATSTPQWGYDADGKLVHPSQVIFNKKYTDFSMTFPEIDPFGIRVPDVEDPSKQVHLQSYRFPAQGKRKAVVQWI